MTRTNPLLIDSITELCLSIVGLGNKAVGFVELSIVILQL